MPIELRQISPNFAKLSSQMRCEKIWVQQCRASRAIRRRFGVKSALDYPIGEKLLRLGQEADHHPEFAKEHPRFLAAVWQTFNRYELAGYVAELRPQAQTRLRRMRYLS